MSQSVCVVGVGMIPFAKPGASESYPMMGARAIRAALADAGLDYDKIQQVYAGYVYGDSCSGQRAVYDVGMSGVPVINVNNNPYSALSTSSKLSIRLNISSKGILPVKFSHVVSSWIICKASFQFIR